MTAAEMDPEFTPSPPLEASIPDPPPGAAYPAAPPPPPPPVASGAASGAPLGPPPVGPPAEPEEGRFNLRRLAWGVGLLLFGGLLYLERIDWVFYAEARRYWPLLLVALGIGVTVLSKRREGRRTGLWLVTWGAWFQLIITNTWGLWGGNAWPLLILAGGVIDLMLPKRGKSRVSGLFPIGAGLWLLANTLHLWGLTWQGSWPLLLVLLGGVLILEALFDEGGGRFTRLRRRRRGTDADAGSGWNGGAR